MGQWKRMPNRDSLDNSGLSFSAAALAALMDLIDPEKCQNWLFDQVWPGEAGKRCPKCQAQLSRYIQNTFRSFKKARCVSCGLQFKATTGSPFYHVRLDPREIVLMAALLEAGIAPRDIAPVIGCGKHTVRLWRRRFEGLTLAEVIGRYQ